QPHVREGLQDLHGGMAAVDGVEVNARRASLQQTYALGDRVLDAQLQDCGGVVPPAVQFLGQFEWQRSPASNGHPLDRRCVDNRHDAGYDCLPDPASPGPLDELEITPVVEEQLRDQKVDT